MSSKVALVTGGASGIGLAAVEHLAQQGWKVGLVDVDAKAGNGIASRLGKSVLFIKANVSSYQDQALAFQRTWKAFGGLDLVLANAGIVDRHDFMQPQPESTDGAPPQPDSLVVDIDLYGPIWSSYLALHYFRKSGTASTDVLKKLIITASSAGLYPISEAPLYSAAKHGAVGLTRSLGRRVKQEKLSITVNCLCPGLVPTGIVSPEMVSMFPKEYITPLDIIVKAVDMILFDDSLNGKAIECNGQEIKIREPPPFLNGAAKFTAGGDYQESISAEDLQRHSERKGREMSL